MFVLPESGIPNGISVLRDQLWNGGSRHGKRFNAALDELDTLVAERDRAQEGWLAAAELLQAAEKLLAAAQDDRDRLAAALDDILAVAEYDGIRMHMLARAALEPSDD